MNLDKLGLSSDGKREAAESAATVGYTASELARVSGITRDQLMRWAKAGLLKPLRTPRGKTAACVYTREQALGVMALGELRRCGVSERRVRAASAVLPVFVSEYAYLVFDGRQLFARSTEGEVVELLLWGKRASFLLSIYALAEKLA